MDFGSPESVKDFPGLYGLEKDADSDSEARGSKQLIGKRKDKKEKDIGYAALGDSSGDEDGDGKSPLKGKMGNPFKFSKKEKREKEKSKDHKEKEPKPKDNKDKDGKAKEMKDKQVKEKVKEEKSKEKSKEERLKEKEKLKDEKRDKEKAKEKTKDKLRDDKLKEKITKEGKEHKDMAKGKTDERKKKKKDKDKGKERKKVEPVDTLEEEPIFGVPLTLAVERSKCHDGVPLPAVVRECIDYIELNGLNCEGIYRLSGVKSKVQQLRRSYNGREVPSLWHYEPHTVASLLKLFLRELPEPVLTADLLPLFDAAAALKDPEKRVSQLRALLDRLPDPNRMLVQYMFKHMEHIIKREKINKMNVQNVSLVLSPTMQISHRVLNAFFLYGKILFIGVTIKKYIPPMADGELPSTAEAIAEEIQKQESLLSQLHSELKAGSIGRRREEQLWQAQRILTQLKRRQRQVRKPSDPDQSDQRAGDEETAAAATSPQRLGRTVQIINEDNVTVIQIGENRLSCGSDAPEIAALEPEADAADTVEVQPASPEPQAELPEPAAASEPALEVHQSAVVPADSGEAEVPPEKEPSVSGEEQTSLSDLHGGGESDHSAQVATSDAVEEPTPPSPAEVPAEVSESAALLREAILLILEEEELRSTERELRSRLAAERSEIGRLKDTIQEMETLYKYRTYSVDSSDASSAADSDDSDTEEELLRRLLHGVRHNRQLEAKNAQLTRAVHEERRVCQRRRAQIRYIELLHSGRA